MSYKFWCSKCKFDHAGECEPAPKIPIGFLLFDEVARQLMVYDGREWRPFGYKAEDGVLTASVTITLPHPIQFIPINFVIHRDGHDEEVYRKDQ
jgi:hypothetical protein